MSQNLIAQAHLGDLAGMNLAGLVRLSVEANSDRSDRQIVPMTGRDIRGRDEQTKDCRTYAERRGGSYVFTYEEPDTSAYKRKRVILPDGRVAYRVVRPVFKAPLRVAPWRQAAGPGTRPHHINGDKPEMPPGHLPRPGETGATSARGIVVAVGGNTLPAAIVEEGACLLKVVHPVGCSTLTRQAPTTTLSPVRAPPL